MQVHGALLTINVVCGKVCCVRSVCVARTCQACCLLSECSPSRHSRESALAWAVIPSATVAVCSILTNQGGGTPVSFSQSSALSLYTHTHTHTHTLMYIHARLYTVRYIVHNQHLQSLDKTHTFAQPAYPHWNDADIHPNSLRGIHSSTHIPLGTEEEGLQGQFKAILSLHLYQMCIFLSSCVSFNHILIIYLPSPSLSLSLSLFLSL